MSTIYSIIQKYQEILSDNLKFSFSSSRPTLGRVGVANRIFIFHLCNDKNLFMEFLKETGLIVNEVNCSRCKTPMKFVAKKISDGFTWSCSKHYEGKKCGNTKSIRKGSWFRNSKLTMEEILFINYEIVRGTKTSEIEAEYYFASNTTAHWRTLINKTISDFMQLHLQKVGGNGKFVEVGISTFGKKINAADAQWIFGGVERDAGKLFLVAISDTSPETLIGIIQKCVEQGTTIYFDASLYNDLDSEEFNNLSLSYNLTYGATECNTLKGTWRHVENALPTVNRQGKLKHYLDVYLFKKYCELKQIDSFNTFLEFVKGIVWED